MTHPQSKSAAAAAQFRFLHEEMTARDLFQRPLAGSTSAHSCMLLPLNWAVCQGGPRTKRVKAFGSLRPCCMRWSSFARNGGPGMAGGQRASGAWLILSNYCQLELCSLNPNYNRDQRHNHYSDSHSHNNFRQKCCASGGNVSLGYSSWCHRTLAALAWLGMLNFPSSLSLAKSCECRKEIAIC